jgi:hypothetical protein
MSLIVRLHFADFETLPATGFARLLCDIQHLSLAVVALQFPERMPLSSAVFDPALQKYSVFIEMRPDSFGEAEVYVSRLQKQSPMWLEFLLRLPKEIASGVASTFKIVFDRLYYPELARRKKSIEVDREDQFLSQERLRTFELALDIEKKITDPRLRELYLRGLRSSLEPLLTQHPEITKVDLDEDDHA